MKKILVYILFLGLLVTPMFSQTVVTKENDNTKEVLRYDDENRLHGRCLAWNQDGVLVAEANYQHGKKQGLWMIYYDNGKPAYEMHYDQGNKVGTWKHWDVSGELVVEKQYTQ